jgi:hypothetical protein
MKKLICFTFLFLLISSTYSQEIDRTFQVKKKIKYDTTRITDLSDKLNIYTGVYGKFHNIELDNSSINKTLKLEPNGNTSLGIGFSYKWIGLGINFSPGFINGDDEIYGKTKSFDTQLNIYTNSFGIDGYFQYYKGFYVKNPDRFMDWENKQFPVRPDLESFAFGISGYYFSNKRFSYKAAFTRTQIQKKSAGSFVTGVYLSINTANAPNGLIPETMPDTLVSFYNINGYKTGTIGFSAGYTYTLVLFKRVFINGSLVPGLGIRTSEFWDNNITTKQDATITGSVTMRIALGYEGKRLYAGLRLVSLIDTYNYESIDISSSSGNISLYVGKRFNFRNPFKKK